ncbi:MAG: VanZ family protein [Planctomycetota bacterium]|nr:VanZ family protein [Planctomycetota bacterium]
MANARDKIIWSGAAAYTAALVAVSLLPSGTGPLKGWDASLSPDLQDALHLPAYSGLVVLWTLAWSTRFRTGAAAVLVITVVCTAFGAAMEAAQYFIPGRTCSLKDGLVNLVGVLTGCLTMMIWSNRNVRHLRACSSPGIGKAQQRRDRCRAMIREHYHSRGWSGAYKQYENLLATVVRKSSVVLDVGCGREFPLAAHLLGLGAEVHGVDPVAEPEQAQSGVTVKRGMAECIPYPDNTFDVVVSRCVLEHLQDPARVFMEFRRVLKPEGHLVFLTPSRYDYISIAARIIPNSLHGKVIRHLEGREEADTFPTYYRANSVRQISDLATQAGFAAEQLAYLNHYPYLLTFSPLLCRIAIAYDEWIRRRQRLHCLQAWLLGSLRCTKAHPGPRRVYSTVMEPA